MATQATPSPTESPTLAPSAPLPQEGGTYVRNEDGSLTKLEE
jgi:hypothetical protein